MELTAPISDGIADAIKKQVERKLFVMLSINTSWRSFSRHAIAQAEALFSSYDEAVRSAIDQCNERFKPSVRDWKALKTSNRYRGLAKTTLIKDGRTAAFAVIEVTADEFLELSFAGFLQPSFQGFRARTK